VTGPERGSSRPYRAEGPGWWAAGDARADDAGHGSGSLVHLEGLLRPGGSGSIQYEEVGHVNVHGGWD
jgi:hypothetical protein